MSPNSKKLEGHIASGAFVRSFVRPSIRRFVTLFDAQHNFRHVHATVLKFRILILQKKKKKKKKIADIYFFSSAGLCPFPELLPFENLWMQYCQQNISKTIKARALKVNE